MTFSLFLALIVAGSIVAGLLTEAIKKFYYNKGKDASPNMIALVMAIVVGGIGTIACYLILGIEFNVINIIGILATMIANWIGAMVGYDKVIQTIQQTAKEE